MHYAAREDAARPAYSRALTNMADLVLASYYPFVTAKVRQLTHLYLYHQTEVNSVLDTGRVRSKIFKIKVFSTTM